MSKFIEQQNWRYATKKFNASKKISEKNLESLKDAMQLSVSSFGLQLYKIIIIENPEIKKQLLPHAYNQSQIVDASHIVVFANQTKVENSDIDSYVNLVSETRNVPTEALSGYGDYLKGAVIGLPDDIKNIWTAKQTYIALANLLQAAAELEIDSCPMEGFDTIKFNEILGLDKQNLNAAVIATIGYRSEEDDTQHYKKVRKSKQNLFINL